MKRAHELLRALFFVLAAAAAAVMLLQRTAEGTLFYQAVQSPLSQSDLFRSFDLGEYGLQQAQQFANRHGEKTEEVLAVWLAAGKLPLSAPQAPLSIMNYRFQKTCLNLFHREAFECLENAVSTLFCDLKCFPVVSDEQDASPCWNFDNSWGGIRTYGGNRTHEGTDICADGSAAGVLPIVSMTDGTVTAIGWLELGGFRIGITSPSGVYIYYAHLESYAQGLEEGTNVRAGQLLGYMGDSGYGPVGTTGQFPVHLHLGMYLTEGNTLYSVNPYWLLHSLADDFLTGAWRPYVAPQ